MRLTPFSRVSPKLAPYLFVAPFIILFCTFGLYPLVKSFVLAFFITSGPKSQVFAGLENFRFLFTDPDFLKAVRNTCVYAVCSVCLQLPLSLALALLLNRAKLRGRNFFRFAFFSPHLVGMVFVGVLFYLIFAPRFGLLNQTLQTGANLLGLNVHLLETKWLGNPSLILPAIILTSLWLYVGFNMIYFLAALQAVDRQLYEAATVDGANNWQQFLHVTLPGIRPVLVFVVLLSSIGSFQLFELPFVMLREGNPDNAGLTIVWYLYTNGFVSGDLGYASAIGWTLALGVMVLALVQFRVGGMWRRE